MDDTAFPDVGKSFQKSAKRPRLLTYLAIVLILLGIAIFAGSRFLGNSNDGNVTPTPAPTTVIEPSETPAPTSDVTPTPEKSSKATPTPAKITVTPKPTAGSTGSSVDKATGLDRAALSIAVQNGSGVKGAASGISDDLKSLGYNVVSTGNADTFDYQNVIIKVKSSKSKYLPLLKKDLSGSHRLGESSSDLSANESADALVIIGK